MRMREREREDGKGVTEKKRTRKTRTTKEDEGREKVVIMYFRSPSPLGHHLSLPRAMMIGRKSRRRAANPRTDVGREGVTRQTHCRASILGRTLITG
jgi:hypothetical protein